MPESRRFASFIKPKTPGISTPTIVNQTEELTKKEGNGTGLFEIKKVDDEYFCFATERTNPKAWTISSMVPSRTSLPKLANRAAKKRIVTHPGEAREPVDSFCVRINTARLPGIPRLGSPLAVQQVARRNPRQPKDGKQANHP
ncbi:T-complex protein 1 subunit gamma [Culex quinquefasciatus]|uniref:T-complex protein 1 subunit gamma n=1 Tax=Culex quinquefasciatus TaxID=7176 RepID=UPI0018E3B0EE|nr:T-complex protein 1 subunit gamma [Culex quinquefasciatus]